MTWLSLSVRLGGFALLLPVALRHLPESDINVWLLFSAVASLQTLSDLGFSHTFGRAISYARSGRPAAAPAIRLPSSAANLPSLIQSMGWVYRRVAVASLALLGTLGTLAVQGVIEQAASATEAWIGWIAIVIASSTAIYGNGYVAYLVGSDRIGLHKGGEAAVGLLSLLSQIAAIQAGLGLSGLVLTAQTGVLVQVYVNRRIATTIGANDWADSDRVPRDPELVRALWPAAWRSAAGIGMAQGVWQAMAIGIANTLAPRESASTLLALRLMQIVIQFAMAPFYTTVPILNRLRAEHQVESLVRLAQRGMFRGHLVFIGCTLIFLWFAPAFLTQIGSRTPFVDAEFWMVLGAAAFVERYGAMHLQLQSTTNEIYWHIASALSGSAWIIGTLALFPVAGALAVPLGLGASSLFVYTPYCLRRSFRSMPGFGWVAFERGALFPALLLTGGPILVAVAVRMAIGAGP